MRQTMSRRLMLAGERRARRRGVLIPRASAQSLEKNHLSLPGAAGFCPRSDPFALRKARAISRTPAFEVEFAVGRRRRRCGQAGGGGQTRRSAAIVADGPIMVARQTAWPVKIVCVFGGKGLHAARGPRGFGYREAGRSQGQDHHRDVLSGHHLLCAARP